MPLRFLFVDFNAYFASVEQQERPELRGKPVVVAPMMSDSTCAIAASYEAKRFGVKTGMGIGEAKRLCQNLNVVEARHHLYIDYHHRLIESVESCVPVRSVLSIDEMACELTGSQQGRENALGLAQRIKKTIALRVGGELRSSIGIAPNLFLSKTASDMQKPNGLVVIEERDLPDILFPLKLEDLSGIGRKMKQRLERQGIQAVRELCASDKMTLRKVWGGIEGDRMFAKLRGEPVSMPETHRSSIGHSHVLPPKLRTEESSFAVLNRLVQKASMRLRAAHYEAATLHASIKYFDDKHWSDAISFGHTQDTRRFIHALTTLWNRKPSIAARPLRVGVELLELEKEANSNPTLFSEENRFISLNYALDKLNTRYGRNTVYYGGAHSARNAAHVRIAFTHIPDKVEQIA